MSSLSGPLCLRRYRWSGRVDRGSQSQALEGKDVKDLLLNVGSGGGAAAAAAPGGGAAAGGEAAAEEKEEEKEEGMQHFVGKSTANPAQRRRNPTTTWALVCSIKLQIGLSSFGYIGVGVHDVSLFRENASVVL